MTDPEKIHRVTRLEGRLLAAHDALSVVLDDEDALGEVMVDAFDTKAPDRQRSVEPEIRQMKATVEWALRAARRRLLKLGAIERR